MKVIKRDDIDLVYRALSNKKVTKYYGVQFDSKEDTKEQMEWYEEQLSTEKGIWWKLTIKGTETSIGACGFNGRNIELGHAEIGFWLLPEYWKKGYMREAIKPVISYGFKSMGLKVICAEVEEGNAASSSLLKQLGFYEKPEKAFTENKDGIQTKVSVYHLERSGF